MNKLREKINVFQGLIGRLGKNLKLEGWFEKKLKKKYVNNKNMRAGSNDHSFLFVLPF